MEHHTTLHNILVVVIMRAWLLFCVFASGVLFLHAHEGIVAEALEECLAEWIKSDSKCAIV
jgi:hypothetical protein